MLALDVRPIGTGDSLNDSSLVLSILLPDDVKLRTAIYGALATLTYPEYWYELGTLTPDEVSEYFAEKFQQSFSAIS